MADTAAPTLTGLTFPARFDFDDDNPKDLQGTFSASATDTESGVDDVVIWLDRNLTYGWFGSTSGTWPLIIVDGTFTDTWDDGKTSEALTISQWNAPGTYSITRVEVTDIVGNKRTYTSTELKELGFATSFEIVDDSPPVDPVEPDLNDAAQLIEGTSAANELNGFGGNDTIDGAGGNDTILGGTGDDRMIGDTGDDDLDGGDGDDTAFFWGSPTEYSFYVRLDGAVEVTDDSGVMGTDVVVNVETFEFQFGGEFTQADLFNPVKVYAGNDAITGTNGNNVLKGYGGNDTIKALGGNDYLHGGLGRDKLYGGLGRDQFVFDIRPTSTNKDTIYDFKAKYDTIQLENAVFKVGSNGTLKAGAFWTNNTGRAHDKDDRVIYDKNSGVLYYDPDGTGSAKAVAFTTITKNLSMSHKDIYVI